MQKNVMLGKIANQSKYFKSGLNSNLCCIVL